MSKRSRRQRENEQLEMGFYRLLLRLDLTERQRVSEELAQPFRRQWFMVDERGVRRLD